MWNYFNFLLFGFSLCYLNLSLFSVSLIKLSPHFPGRCGNFSELLLNFSFYLIWILFSKFSVIYEISHISLSFFWIKLFSLHFRIMLIFCSVEIFLREFWLSFWDLNMNSGQWNLVGKDNVFWNMKIIEFFITFFKIISNLLHPSSQSFYQHPFQEFL